VTSRDLPWIMVPLTWWCRPPLRRWWRPAWRLCDPFAAWAEGLPAVGVGVSAGRRAIHGGGHWAAHWEDPWWVMPPPPGGGAELPPPQ